MCVCVLPFTAAKVTIAASNCRVIDGDGNTHVLSEDADTNGLPETAKQLLEHAQQVSIAGQACVYVMCVHGCPQ